MRFDTTLQQRLEQRMVLAPKMIQAMEILQLPLMALQERIDQELETNPVLEMRDNRDQPEDGPAEEGAPTDVAETERELVVEDEGGEDDFERLSNLVDRWDTYFEDSAQWRRSVPRGGEDPKFEAMQNTPDEGESLQESLLRLWHLEEGDPRVSVLGEIIIRNLDDDGYLRSDLAELGELAEPEADAEEMEHVLALVQRVGPAGSAARDLRECLLLQLEADPTFGEGPGDLPNGEIEVRLIREHLEDIEANRLPQIARRLGVDMETLKEGIARVCRLNPRPGAALTSSRTPTIVPDVRIDWDDELGEWRVTSLKGGTPELYISKTYRQLLKQKDLDPETKQFVTRKVRSAQWLMDAITQRQDTLGRVVESIVKFQRPFFDEGPDHIRPLKMQQVADDVDLHVATISRSVADKYADTPWGIYPLRDFFTGGTQTAGGDEVAWDRIQMRLKEVIDAEDKSKPLSDKALQEKLLAEGFDIARRTVAKYREELGIPSSRKRREY